MDIYFRDSDFNILQYHMSQIIIDNQREDLFFDAPEWNSAIKIVKYGKKKA